MSKQHVCGTGSRGVIVDRMERHNGIKLVINRVLNPTIKRKLFKVTTDKCIHFRDLTQASYLTVIDPQQKFFVYPVATYTMPGNKQYLEQLDLQNPVPGKRFDVNAPNIYVDVIPNAGRSLHALAEDETELTPRQAIAAIKNLVNGMAVLHGKNIIHGDIHEHNVVIDISSDDKICARWIDFSEMKTIPDEDMLKMQTDVKRLIRIVKMIAGMVPGTHEALDTMSYELGKGSAPMSAVSLQSMIDSYLKKRSRASSSRSRSSSSRGHVSKKLAF